MNTFLLLVVHVLRLLPLSGVPLGYPCLLHIDASIAVGCTYCLCHLYCLLHFFMHCLENVLCLVVRVLHLLHLSGVPSGGPMLCLTLMLQVHLVSRVALAVCVVFFVYRRENFLASCWPCAATLAPLWGPPLGDPSLLHAGASSAIGCAYCLCHLYCLFTFSCIVWKMSCVL